jgi:hypothetical protein
MVLTNHAFSETLGKEKVKEDKLASYGKAIYQNAVSDTRLHFGSYKNEA